MNLLFLGPGESAVLDYLRQVEEEVAVTSDPLTVEVVERRRPDFVVSHGYRHIIRREVLARLPDRIVNLHISLLPWNRGADPNVWSFLEDTPKGVTIHYVDERVDTGDIIAQKERGVRPGRDIPYGLREAPGRACCALPR